MAMTVTVARQPDATAGADMIHRSLFDSFNPDSGGRRAGAAARGS
jgi:hypothetical protein